MQHRELNTALACLTVTAAFLVTWSIVRSQGTTGRARSVGVEQDSILRSAQKPKAPISDGRSENITRAKFTVAEINNFMRARRNQAWAIVQQVWEPVPVAGSKIPAWMTWYEEQDIAQLYRELISKQMGTNSATTPAEVRANVAAVLKEHPFKDLQTSQAGHRSDLLQHRIRKAPARERRQNSPLRSQCLSKTRLSRFFSDGRMDRD
jgi:hypothetical protein